MPIITNEFHVNAATGFHQSSPWVCSPHGIAHHVTDPRRHAHPDTTHSGKSVAGVHIPANISIVQTQMVATYGLAGILESLVRISRRHEWAHALHRARHAQAGK